MDCKFCQLLSPVAPDKEIDARERVGHVKNHQQQLQVIVGDSMKFSDMAKFCFPVDANQSKRAPPCMSRLSEEQAERYAFVRGVSSQKLNLMLKDVLFSSSSRHLGCI